MNEDVFPIEHGDVPGLAMLAYQKVHDRTLFFFNSIVPHFNKTECNRHRNKQKATQLITYIKSLGRIGENSDQERKITCVLVK